MRDFGHADVVRPFSGTRPEPGQQRNFGECYYRTSDEIRSLRSRFDTMRPPRSPRPVLPTKMTDVFSGVIWSRVAILNGGHRRSMLLRSLRFRLLALWFLLLLSAGTTAFLLVSFF